MKKKYIFRQFRILFFLLLSLLTINPLFANSFYSNQNVVKASFFVDSIRKHNRIENEKIFINDYKTLKVIYFGAKHEFGIIENSAAWKLTNSTDMTSVNLVKTHATISSLLEKTYILLRQFNI